MSACESVSRVISRCVSVELQNLPECAFVGCFDVESWVLSLLAQAKSYPHSSWIHKHSSYDAGRVRPGGRYRACDAEFSVTSAELSCVFRILFAGDESVSPTQKLLPVGQCAGKTSRQEARLSPVSHKMIKAASPSGRRTQLVSFKLRGPRWAARHKLTFAMRRPRYNGTGALFW